jgi:hypothetical protein
MLGPPTNGSLVEIDVLPAEAQDTAEPTARAQGQDNHRSKKRLHVIGHTQDALDRRRIDHWAFRILLGRTTELLQYMAFEGAPGLVLLTGPIQSSLEDGQIPLDGVGANTCFRTPPSRRQIT